MKKWMKGIKGALVCGMMVIMMPFVANAAEGDVAIDETHFPNVGFRQYISETIDINGDGILSTAEADAVTRIDADFGDDGSVVDFGYFSNLKELRFCEPFDGYYATWYKYDPVKTIDISRCTKLEILDCSQCALSELNISNNTKLKELYLGFAKDYEETNPHETIIHNGLNHIEKLDLSNCHQIEIITCYGIGLKELNLNGCNKIRKLYCSGTSWVLKQHANLTRYSEAEEYGTELTKLDLSHMTDLEVLMCYASPLTELSISDCKKLKEIDCHNCQLQSIDISDCPLLLQKYVDPELNGMVLKVDGTTKTVVDGNGSGVRPYSDEWIKGYYYNNNGTLAESYSGYRWKDISEFSWYFVDASYPMEGWCYVQYDESYLIGNSRQEYWFLQNTWAKIDGVWYFFDKDGIMASCEWRHGYWINKNGSQTYKWTGSWIKDGKFWLFKDTSGWYAKNQWQKMDGKWYFFDQKGHMVANQWKYSGGSWYYLSNNGSAIANAWVKINGAWYYFDEDCCMAAGEWRDGYWLNKNGSWTYKGKASWYSLEDSGSGYIYKDNRGWFAVNQWQKIDGLWYYFDENGISDKSGKTIVGY